VMIETTGTEEATDRAPGTAPDRWWVAPVALLVVFWFLLWQVAAHGPVTRADVHLRDAIQRRAARPGLAWLRPIGRALANLGDQSVAIPVLVVVTGFVLWHARRHGFAVWRPLAVAVGAGAALAAVIPLKIWVGRPGPAQLVLGNANLGFFPSGHTADAMLCYGAAALLLGGWVLRTAWARWAAGVVAVGLVTGTIFGLLWSNYHWVSDVVGSLCWCGAALLILRRCQVGPSANDGRELSPPPS
jgi:membrane-associated phospholipid phosphatase